MAEILTPFRYVFKGTKAEFASQGKAQADANGWIVFIKDPANNGAGSCIYAQGMYFGDIQTMIMAMSYVKGVNIGGTNYNAAAGGGYLKIEAADPATVSVTAGSDGVKIALTTAFVTKVNDTATQLATIAADYLTSADKTALNTLITNLSNKVGDTADLATTSKTVVGAINEIAESVSMSGTAAKVTLTASGATGDYAQVYTLKQGTATVGTINIPKDMVVTGGEIVTNPSEQPAGTYIKLTLQNVANPLYINVAQLVDVYTAQQNATQVQLTVGANNVISAVIVAGSITATELASNAVATAKIQDGAVTKAKLATAVQTAIDKAENAAAQSNTYTKAEVNAMFAWGILS